MDVKLSRREFFKLCATSIGGSSLAALGFAPGAALAEVREFKSRRHHPHRAVAAGVHAAAGRTRPASAAASDSLLWCSRRTPNYGPRSFQAPRSTPEHKKNKPP